MTGGILSREKAFTEGKSVDCYRFLGCHRVSVMRGIIAPENPDSDICIVPEHPEYGVLHSLKAADSSRTEPFVYTVFAPNAKKVRVIGDFNDWGMQPVFGDEMQMDPLGFWHSGELYTYPGTLYKYDITGADGIQRIKNDPFCVSSELRPGTASKAADLPVFCWQDGEWIRRRVANDPLPGPMNIYELHAGSWKRGRIPDIDYEVNWQEAEKRRNEEPFLNYREIADELSVYVSSMGYTHVELMPLCEHPLDGSWGYQTGNYYSLTSRYGSPEDFMYFVDRMHRYGIGVILDWVPGHFCKDDSWLYRFDGTFLFEYDAENKRENPLWGTANFDMGKGCVRSFLISNALMWLKEYHVDGLRVDAVSNLLYYDYSCMHDPRPQNMFGGYENMEAAAFLKLLNNKVHRQVPGAVMIAEDSSTWPRVTERPPAGLGFDLKWNMGWMNDSLSYMALTPEQKRLHHNKLTFSLMYAYSERYVLPVSHDEAVHGKKTLLDKMNGDLWKKFAYMRAYMVYMLTHPGKKLLFMGNEFGQLMEWRFYEALEWKMVLYPPHDRLREFIRALNHIYLDNSALWILDNDPRGFRWIDADNASQSIYSYIRYDGTGKGFLIVLLNMSDMYYPEFRLGVPEDGNYKILISGDEARYGGAGNVDNGTVSAELKPWNRQPYSIKLKLAAQSGCIIALDSNKAQ